MRLSVIIPGYNNPLWRWERCLASVAAVLTDEDEIIVVDDGSAEPFDVAQIQGFRGGKAALKVVRLEKNEGQALARNVGLDCAKGEFVTFVDSDDALKGDPYGPCIQELSTTGADVCVYGVNVVWKDEGLQKHDLPTAADVETLHRENLFNYAVNKVIRKAFLDEKKIRFDPDGMPCEDVMFYLQTVMAGAKWCFVPVEGYIYFLNANGSQVTRYERRYVKGTTTVAHLWRQYVAVHPAASEYLERLALSEAEIRVGEWANSWKQGSPVSLAERWAKAPSKKAFFAMLVKSFVRRHLYFRPLRRRHYRGLYRNVEEYSDFNERKMV